MRIIYIILFLSHFWSYNHPVHVSVTNVTYQPDSSAFTISIKLFRDDFEANLYHLYGTRLNFLTGTESNETKTIIEKYINTNFWLIANKQQDSKQNLKYKKKKANQESIWLYFEYKLDEPLHNIDIHNSLMNDFFYDQTNLLIFSYGDMEKGYAFNYDTVSAEISLSQ